MRAPNMQALTDGVRRRKPGVVIYGKGDAAHALRVSDHNEDDTPGVRAEQSDADSIPEHRAIDIMLGPSFTRADAYELIGDLLGDPAARARLTYLIFDGSIWSASRRWERRDFDGDPHTDHIHASGRAAQDANAAPWPAAERTDDMFTDEDRRRLNAVYAALFTGGPSCGVPVDDAHIVNPEDANAAKYKNSVFSQLAQIRAEPGTGGGATAAEVADAVVAEFADKLGG